MCVLVFFPFCTLTCDISKVKKQVRVQNGTNTNTHINHVLKTKSPRAV